MTQLSATSDEGPTSSGRARRSDARRNIDAILDAAGRLLPDNPRASMQEVAVAAGVHRATVHRHFPSRDDLLTALRARTLEQVLDVIGDPSLASGPADSALVRLTNETLRYGNRTRTWRVLPTYDDASDERAERFRRPLEALMRRGQQAGVVRRDVDALLLVAAWGGLVAASLPLIANGAMTTDQATAWVCRMLAAS